MPLTTGDRKFLNLIDRLKIYLLGLAIAIFLFLLLTPSDEIRTSTSIIGLALCGTFWLTQRLLTYITFMDIELNKVIATLKKVVPEEYAKEFSRHK
jgi:hypothetical protein